jgi:hypothetical protein
VRLPTGEGTRPPNRTLDIHGRVRLVRSIVARNCSVTAVGGVGGDEIGQIPHLIAR